MITPVILCGGSGTRLWPLSRKSYPKQFARLLGENTLLQDTVLRLTGSGYGPPVVVTSTEFRFIVAEQMAQLGVEPAAILIEPEGRNTAPAILAAALWIEQNQPDTTILIAPSDHVVHDAEAFHAALHASLASVASGNIITIGITPTHAETGYGYLELSAKAADTPVPLKQFVEKPDPAAAAALVANDHVLWNGGIFLFDVPTILKAFGEHAPNMVPSVTTALDDGKIDFGFLRLDAAAWGKVENISIDYAVMERADNLSAIRFDGGWSDLGGWNAVWSELDRDENGVASAGQVTAIDCHNSLLRSEDESVELVGIGLTDIIAIATPDAVLVSKRENGEEVKNAVGLLKSKGARQAEDFPKSYRPWGWFESLVIGDRFQVKRIMVEPGASLSLQSHHHRSEHWIIVEGTARITLGEDKQLLTENQSIYIPLGTVHRIENPGKVPMVMIEVQTGSYLGEDDILRYEDVYARQ